MIRIPPICLETFPALSTLRAGVFHTFVRRIPDVPVDGLKPEVLDALRPWHLDAVRESGIDPADFFTAEQVHGADTAVVEPDSPRHLAGVDGLMTRTPGLLLGIHVADCAPVFVVDPVGRAVAVLHSGRKGTEANIVGRAVDRMTREFGTIPANLVVQIGPCIRPPLFEVDIAARIAADAAAAGVLRTAIHDCQHCTGSDTARYYSYRVEKSRTGRMLALLALLAPSPNARKSKK